MAGWVLSLAGLTNLVAGFATGRRPLFAAAAAFFAAGICFFVSARRRGTP
jgi:hypothetical protein